MKSAEEPLLRTARYPSLRPPIPKLGHSKQAGIRPNLGMRMEREAVRAEQARMAVSKRFGMYKDEGKKVVRSPEVVEDQTLRQLREAWRNVRWKDDISMDGEYKSCLKAVKGIQYTAKDVERFSVALADAIPPGWNHRVGYFLSALINNCPDTDFIIHTKHLDTEIYHLGHHNTKNITIDGNAGDYLARSMSGGKITVEGNVGCSCGSYMKDGEIVINGDCASVGDNLFGGKITVKGAVKFITRKIYGGEIHIEGEAQAISHDINDHIGYPCGSIFYKGKEFFPWMFSP